MRNLRLKYLLLTVSCITLTVTLVYELHEFIESSSRIQETLTLFRKASWTRKVINEEKADNTEPTTGFRGSSKTRRLTGHSGSGDEGDEGKADKRETEGATLKKTTEIPADNPMFIPEYIRRRAKADEACMDYNQNSLPDKADYLVRHETSHNRTTSYCVIPKIACTFWLSVFRFLQNDTRGRSSPLAMSKADVHYTKSKIPTYDIMAAGARDFRFMFVREPYSRLWSAYVDKFLLPDFWMSEGKRIAKKMRGNSTVNRCAKDISFREFVKYVLASDPQKMNAHWRPVFYVCNPCTYRPHLIGKLETFSQDARHVLRHMNASWVLDSVDQKHRLELEVKHLIDFNFRIGSGKGFANCTSSIEVAQRLWMAFQINGYIPNEMLLPRARLKGKFASDVKAFKHIVHEALESQKGRSHAEWRAQRERTMVKAYRDIPSAMMRRLRDLYRKDFATFGYDPLPPSLFPRKT